MTTMRAQAARTTLAVVLLGMSTSSAYAYLDPGTGSMILQVLLGGIAGLALAGRLYWHKLVSLFRDRTDARPPEDKRPDTRR